MASTFRKKVSEYASRNADRFVKTLFHDEQAPNMNANRLEKLKKHWDIAAVKRAHDGMTDYNVGRTGWVQETKWFHTFYHFPVIAAMFNVNVVLYDLDQGMTKLWKPGDEEGAICYHGSESGLHSLDEYVATDQRLCIRLIYYSRHYQYLARYSIT